MRVTAALGLRRLGKSALDRGTYDEGSRGKEEPRDGFAKRGVLQMGGPSLEGEVAWMTCTWTASRAHNCLRYAMWMGGMAGVIRGVRWAARSLHDLHTVLKCTTCTIACAVGLLCELL